MRLAAFQPKREDVAVLLFVFALSIIVNVMIEQVGGTALGLGGYLPNVQFYLLALVFFVCAAVAYLLIRYRPDSPVQFLREGEPARAQWRTIAGALPLLLAVGAFMPSFALIKSGIPLFTAYDWDARFIALDQALHFGVDPWRLLQPVLGYPIVTAALAKIYHSWFLLIYAGALYMALLVKDRALRQRYFLSYFAVWTIGGMAMAVGFASVGPCFLEPLLGNTHYADQMAYLQAANLQYPVTTLAVQDELVAWYRAGEFGLGRGISAMPSMHVALAFLYYLAMRKVSRWAGWFFGAFCFVITLASVHLGYHYAVDGYVSLALVGAIWWLVGKLVPRLLSPEVEPAAATEIAGVPARA
jgi:hypothetical protein